MPVEIHKDRIVLDYPKARRKGSSAEILFYGATVISWKSPSLSDPTVQERLFVSSKAALDGSKPVRGGIPVVFPCFGPPKHEKHLRLAQHGFARDEVWTYEGVVVDNETNVSVKLSLNKSKASYEADFHLTYIVTLAEYRLGTELHVKNTSPSPRDILEFQALLHNYLRAPANELQIGPLYGLNYYDKTEVSGQGPATAKKEARSEVDVKTHTDSVYENVPRKVDVTWTGGHVEIELTNFKDVVVWNPGEEGRKISDMEDGGWERYVCVEPGFVCGFVPLPAGQEWVGQQVMSIKA